MSLSHKCLSSVCQIQLPWSFDFFSLSQKQINGSSDSHYLFCLCSQPRHHSWQFRRWNREGSCLSEFFFLLLVIFTLELGNKTIAIPRVFFLLSKWKSFMLDDLCEEITNKCKFLRMVMLTKFIGGFTLFWLFVLWSKTDEWQLIPKIFTKKKILAFKDLIIVVYRNPRYCICVPVNSSFWNKANDCQFHI